MPATMITTPINGDIVVSAYQDKKQGILEEKKRLEHLYLSKPAEELSALNQELLDITKQYGIYSVQAQQYYHEKLPLVREIHKRIQLQARHESVGKALERIAAIESDIAILDDETNIREQLNERSFPSKV